MRIVSLLLGLLFIGDCINDAQAVGTTRIVICGDHPGILDVAYRLSHQERSTPLIQKWNVEKLSFERVEFLRDSSAVVSIEADTIPPVEGDISHLQMVMAHSNDKLNYDIVVEVVKSLRSNTHIGDVTVILPTPIDEQMFAKEVLQLFKDKHFRTKVSLRDSITAVDSNHRTIVGKLTSTGDLVWSVPDSVVKQVTAKVNNQNEIIVETSAFVEEPTYYVAPISAKKIDLPHLLKYDQVLKIKDGKNNGIDYFNQQQVFTAIQDATKKYFGRYSIKYPKRWNERGEMKTVKFRDGPTDVKVRTIWEYKDFIGEIIFWGEKGFPYQGNDPNVDISADRFVHFRHGDWVLQMKVQSKTSTFFKIQPFYIKLVGVIVNENPGDESQLKNMKIEIPKIPSQYRLAQPKTDAFFFSEAKSWMNGEILRIRSDSHIASAANAEVSAAMFMVESIREFSTHLINIMYLDEHNHGSLSRHQLFEFHPMARGGTGPAKYSGYREGIWNSEKLEGRFQVVKSLMASKVMTYMIHVSDPNGLTGSVAQTGDPHDPVKNMEILRKSFVKRLSEMPKQGPMIKTSDYKSPSPTACRKRSTSTCPAINSFDDSWDARHVDIAEIRASETQLETFKLSEDASLGLRSSMALLSDHVAISNEIALAVQERETSSDSSYLVDPESIHLEKGHLKFELIDRGNPARTAESPELVEKNFEDSHLQLSSVQILDETKSRIKNVQKKPGSGTYTLAAVGKGVQIYGAILGLQGSLLAFEQGNITHGAINLAMTLNQIGIDSAILKAAGRALGTLTRGVIEGVAVAAKYVVGEKTVSSALSLEKELVGATECIGEFVESIPSIGTVFGLYNIVQDFQRKETIGYVDAGLDILLMGLPFAGPEAEPFIILVTILRLSIDNFYYNIKKELQSLPPDASTGEHVVAVLKGIGEALVEILDTLTGELFSFVEKSFELDMHYDKDQKFLSKLADYNSYFVIKKESTGSSALNFVDGLNFWNGGSIDLVLNDNGTAHLSMMITNKDGKEELHEETILCGQNATDIVMGIGESHTIDFASQTVHLLWVFTVDSKKLISGQNGHRNTLHGSYTGNRADNNFFAVQDLPNSIDWGYTLDKYFYHLRGMEGNDMFYLGPQKALVEGGEGSDVYFVNISTTLATLNNLAMDKVNDFVILQHNYTQLSLKRSGQDVNITFLLTRVVLQNWFTSSAYQHMTLRTKDGVLFRITVDDKGLAHPQPFKLTAAGFKAGTNLNASQPAFATVSVLLGSDHDDKLIGNALANTLIGGKGSDLIIGGPGADVYIFNMEDNGYDIINNFAPDKQEDIVILPSTFANIVSRRIGSNLVLLTASLQLTLQDWFKGDEYQHCVFLTKDYIVFEVNSTDLSFVPMILDLKIPSTKDMTNTSVLQRIPTVVGSVGSDSIIANAKDNYIALGKGDDFVQGGEGGDIYVMKENDGSDTINNLSADKKDDLLLFETTYSDIQVKFHFNDNHLVLTSSKNMSATLLNWFTRGVYRHLTVRSVDGITFDLPDTKEAVKRPFAIDCSHSKTPQSFDLNSAPWNGVEKVLGSQDYDEVMGNNLTNYMDPGPGRGAQLQGNNGSDTYVVKAGYGHVVIDNNAADVVTDSLLFLFPLHSITCKVVKEFGISLVLGTTNSNNDTTATLKNYIGSNNSRHLTVITSDGFTFVPPIASGNSQPCALPIIMNRYKDNTGQFINLTAHDSFASVRTVYGARSHRNHIYGNAFSNTLVGGNDDDCIDGCEGDDVLKGEKGADRITGGEGQDTLVGGSGNDSLDGGPGNDILVPGPGNNTVHGGEGDDTVFYEGDPFNRTGVIVDLNNEVCQHPSGVDALVDVENVYGTPFKDTLISAVFADNVLSGRGGDDTLIANAGYDILIGGEGQDTYDLSLALGTKVIVNFARDRKIDSVYLSYVKSDELRYEIIEDNLIIRRVSPLHRSPLIGNLCAKANKTVPEDEFDSEVPTNATSDTDRHKVQPFVIFPTDVEGNPINSARSEYPSATFCEAYDSLHPTIVLKDWFKGEAHQHLVIHTQDCILDEGYLRSPVPVCCHLYSEYVNVTYDQTNHSDYRKFYKP